MVNVKSTMAEADLFLATASGENVKLWRMPNLDLHNIWPFNDIVNCTCWSSNSILLKKMEKESVLRNTQIGRRGVLGKYTSWISW